MFAFDACAASPANTPQADNVRLTPLSPQKALSALKGKKIVSVQDYEKINPLDQYGWGKVNAPVDDYDRHYPARLKKYLGLEVVTVPSSELVSQMKNVSPGEAEKVAETWISEATRVEIVKKRDVIRNARLYLALKALLEKHHGAAITMTTWYLSGTHNPRGPVTNVMLPLSILEFSKKHVPSSCQSHIDCLATMLAGTYLTGGAMGFDGDVLNDNILEPTGERPKNVIVIGHCGAPINPHGNDRLPYVITDHVVNNNTWAKRFGKDVIPVATTVRWPAGKRATVVKVDIYRGKISIFTGTILDGEALYKNFSRVLCRNKIVVQMDDPERCYLLPADPKGGAFRDWFGSWGCHQVVFYGDLTEKFEKLAQHAGLQVVK
jgi:hypothetical protein